MSDLKDMINNKENIKLCDMLVQLEEKVKILENENICLKEKILGKDDIITDLSQKYSEYHSHLTQLCEGMYFSTNTIDSPITDITCNSDYSEELISDLIVSNLYSNYEVENSLNLNLINKGISKNFNFFLNSIFSTTGDNYSISILHEYLEDIFLRIYSFYMKKMLRTQRLNSKNDIWEINGNELNEEDIEFISIDIYSNNILKLITNYFSESKSSNFDKLTEKFLDKFNDNMKNSDKKVKEMLKIEGPIYKKLNNKISKEKEDSISLVKELVKLCLENISSGKLCNKDNIIYDFKKFYIEYLNLDKQNFEGSFNFNINYDSHDSVDHFINSIKYKQHSLNSLYITTNIKSTIKLPLGKLVNYSIMYVPELKHFTLTEAIVTINQVKSLAKLIRFSQLETLDLSNNKLGDTFVRILSDCLKCNQTLKVIYLSNNNITSLGGSYLAEAFKKNCSIEKVILGTNRINDYGLQGLVKSVSINRTIKHLDISDNDLDYNDLIYLTNNLIPNNKSIEILNLSRNRFDPESVNDLGFSLKKNNSIKILHLNYASLNEDSSPYFFKHLSGTSLSEIYLENNYLGEIGGILLSNVLRNNINLTVISLKNCALNSVSLSCIAKALDVNNTLKSLNLEANRFDDPSLLSLKGVTDKKLIKVSLSGSCLSTRSVDIIKQSTNLIIN
jgi:Ran GTPase-activating protein (RanGAP) involved in mRNA processing and transport